MFATMLFWTKAMFQGVLLVAFHSTELFRKCVSFGALPKYVPKRELDEQWTYAPFRLTCEPTQTQHLFFPDQSQ